MKTVVEKKKLYLISELLKLQNEDIMDKIESMLRVERLKALEEELNTPLTLQQFGKMIDRAEKDASEGRVMSTETLKRKVQSWK